MNIDLFKSIILQWFNYYFTVNLKFNNCLVFIFFNFNFIYKFFLQESG